MTKKCECGKEIEDKYGQCYDCLQTKKKAGLSDVGVEAIKAVKARDYNDGMRWGNSLTNASNLFIAKMSSTAGKKNFDEMSLVNVGSAVISLARILYFAEVQETK